MARSSGVVTKPRTSVGISADVDGGDGDRGVLAVRVLAHVEGPDRLQAGDDDDQVDHQGQDRAAYEEVGDFHLRVIKFTR